MTIIRIRGEAFDDDEIESVSMFLGNSILGDKLTIDTLDFTVRSTGSSFAQVVPIGYRHIALSDGRVILFRKSNETNLMEFNFGDPVTIEHGGGQIAKFYIKEVARENRELINHTCVSAIGLLDVSYHVGGIYEGELFTNVVADIMDSRAIYTVDALLMDAKVYGWLPYDTRRNNLSQLLLVFGASIKRTSTGEFVIGYISTAAAKEISDDNIFIGGTTSIENPATKVEITEHSFRILDTDRIDVLYDNTDGSGTATDKFIEFTYPYYDLKAVGLVIHSSGANFAVVSGTGTLSGSLYTHVTNVVSKVFSERISMTENTIKVPNATLINTLNSDSISERILNFKALPNIANVEFLTITERPTDFVSFDNEDNIPQSGVISQMSYQFGRAMKVNGKILTNYEPPRNAGQYTRRAVLTNNADWAPPTGVDKFKVVMISGGAGGDSGQNGTDGERGSISKSIGSGKSGDVGIAGTAGTGGRIYSQELRTVDYNKISVSIGVGGESDTKGEETTIVLKLATTTIEILSTASGQISSIGYRDILTGGIYAESGDTGTDGGLASEYVGMITYPDGSFDTGIKKNTVIFKRRTYYSGDVGYFDYRYYGKETLENVVAMAYGGVGGGAAVGLLGLNGNEGRAGYNQANNTVFAWAGDGGDGANATTPNANTNKNGSGGHGGHGGGAGGGGGNAYSKDGDSYQSEGRGGAGGKGSEGGTGASGLVIIYY